MAAPPGAGMCQRGAGVAKTLPWEGKAAAWSRSKERSGALQNTCFRESGFLLQLLLRALEVNGLLS